MENDNDNRDDGGASEPAPSDTFTIDGDASDGSSHRARGTRRGTDGESRGSTGDGIVSERDGGRGDDGSDGSGESGERRAGLGSDGSGNRGDDGSGGGSASGRGEGDGRPPRKSGRHKRDCTCAKCVTRRDAAASGIPLTNDPKQISYDRLTNAKLGNEKAIQTEAVGITLQMLFGAPTLMLPPGTADHWPLDSEEEKQLTRRIQDVLDMMPKKKKSAMMKFLGKYMPPMALLATAGIIIVPRAKLTKELLDAQKTKRPTQPQPNPHHGIAADTEGTSTPGRVVGSIDGSDGSDRGSVNDATYRALASEEAFT